MAPHQPFATEPHSTPEPILLESFNGESATRRMEFAASKHHRTKPALIHSYQSNRNMCSYLRFSTCFHGAVPRSDHCQLPYTENATRSNKSMINTQKHPEHPEHPEPPKHPLPVFTMTVVCWICCGEFSAMIINLLAFGTRVGYRGGNHFGA